MQSTRYPFGEKVVPHTPGAVGSVAGEEAGANLRAELFITPAALTARLCQPGRHLPRCCECRGSRGGSRSPAHLANWGDGICRGSVSPNEDVIGYSCQAREAVVSALDKLGWCYGKIGQAGANMRWHKCTKGSQHTDLENLAGPAMSAMPR
jgi:hypothetical protein